MRPSLCLEAYSKDLSTHSLSPLLLAQATRGLSESITEYAETSNETFPFVTIDIFETLARHVREQSGIESLVYSPIVRDRDRSSWEDYSVRHQQWIQDSIHQYQPSPELVSSEAVTYGKMDRIFPSIFTLPKEGQKRVPAVTESSYAPYWHVSPFPSTTYFVNSDQLQTPYFDRTVFRAASVARGKMANDCEQSRSVIKTSLTVAFLCLLRGRLHAKG